ncbi:MAG TPA: hypothetical protein VEA41_03015, partial [Salinarimonas sp.]|nr:hypothetical protein [Salinarimonas sp.]
MKAVDGSNFAWQPLPIQRFAMACPARELLYGGEKGGAKTSYLVASICELLGLAHRKWEATGKKQFKCRIGVFRKNL